MTFGCMHYSNILTDMEDGMLTGEELREKMKEVESDFGTAPKAREVARYIVAALTKDDADAFSSQVLMLAMMCEPVWEELSK